MRKILLVEDYKELRQELAEILSDEGYQVYEAETMREGWDKFLSEKIDLCLLDVGLPDGNGITLCEKIKRISHVPIIFLTASVEEEQIVKGLGAGGDDYIGKPFGLKELLARIEVQLRRINVDNQSIVGYRSGELELDLQQYCIEKNGVRLDITPIEFNLCLTLLRGKGITIIRERLMEDISERTNSYVEDNTLSVYISRLKKKLGDFQGKSYIETSRGYGYYWTAPVYESAR